MMDCNNKIFRGRCRGFTASAEQENRVRIPDGTAAVCAELSFFDESQSLGKTWEGKREREEDSLDA